MDTTTKYQRAIQFIESPESHKYLEQGTIFTSFPRIEGILDRLPESVWKDPNHKFLDPVCGRGSFLLAIKYRLLKYHPEQHIIENMLYGCDISEKNCNFAKRLLSNSLEVSSNMVYKTNIYNDNSLSRKWNMKFDVVVGNPPWNAIQTGKNSDIYDKFFYLSMNLTNESPDGTIVLITSGNFLWSSKKKFATLRQAIADYGIERIEERDSQKDFGIMSDEASIAYLKRGAGSSCVFHDLNGGQHSVILSRNPFNLTSQWILDVLKKVQNKWPNTLLVERGRTTQLTKQADQGQNGKGEVSVIQTPKHIFKTMNRVSDPDNPGKPQWVWCDQRVDDDVSQYRVAYGILSTNKNLGPIHILNPGEQATQVVCYAPCGEDINDTNGHISWLKSKVFTTFLNAFRVATNNSLGIVRKLPAPHGIDKKRSWTDEELYQYFNLTEDEINLIESTIK